MSAAMSLLRLAALVVIVAALTGFALFVREAREIGRAHV